MFIQIRHCKYEVSWELSLIIIGKPSEKFIWHIVKSCEEFLYTILDMKPMFITVRNLIIVFSNCNYSKTYFEPPFTDVYFKDVFINNSNIFQKVRSKKSKLLIFWKIIEFWIILRCGGMIFPSEKIFFFPTVFVSWPIELYFLN